MTGRPAVRGPAGSLSTSNHYPPDAEPSPEAVTAVLSAAVTALDDAEVPHVLMGGLVVARYARPRATDDIDLFVRPEHARRALDVLDAAGFEVEEVDPMWLFKAFKDGVLVDVIFRSSGEIYLDDDMLAHGVRDEVRGQRSLLISPEDLLVVKAVATAEHGPHHWYDALAIIARTPLDWGYVLQRARQAGPRRVLSLLLYAESNDLAVPAEVIEELHATIHGGRS